MESIQQIKRRINSIVSTKQITQSMRMVSSSKVVKARAKMEQNREFIDNVEKLLHSALASPALASHRYVKPKPVGVNAVIVIASDRGLCGGYNVSVSKFAHGITTKSPCKVVTVGGKARDYLVRRRVKDIAKSFTGISENPFFEDASEIAGIVSGWYDEGQVDSVLLVYTRFVSMLTQEPSVKKLLPLDIREDREITVEPYVEEYLEEYLPFYLSSEIYGGILESSLCEQCSRITSMDTAVKNSGDMIDALTLRYNQARQGAITQELTEIIGGTLANRE